MIAVQGSNGVEGTLVDNAELIVSGLAKGAAACSRRVTRAGASGARGHFLALVAFRLPADQRDRIGLAERVPRAGSAPLPDAFRQAGALPPDGNRPRPPVSRPPLILLPPHLARPPGARRRAAGQVRSAIATAPPPGSSAATARRSTSWQGRTGTETIIVTRAELQRRAMRAVSA